MESINFNGKLPPAITAEENTKLLEEYKKTGDLELKDKILLGNLRLVSYTINKMACDFGSLEEDVYSMGVVELSRAIDAFDPSKSINFSTYAVTVIKKNVFSALKRQQSKGPAPLSLEEPLMIDENIDITLGDTLRDEGENPQLWNEEMYNKKLISEVSWYINNMISEKRKFIMEHMWGINGCEHLDGLSIAKLMNRSKSYVYVEYRNTLEQIKRYLIDRGLIEGKKRRPRTRTKREDLSV